MSFITGATIDVPDGDPLTVLEQLLAGIEVQAASGIEGKTAAFAEIVFVNTVRFADPVITLDIYAHDAFGAANLRDLHLALDFDPVIARQQVMRAQANGVAAVGQVCKSAGKEPVYRFAEVGAGAGPSA